MNFLFDVRSLPEIVAFVKKRLYAESLVKKETNMMYYSNFFKVCVYFQLEQDVLFKNTVGKNLKLVSNRIWPYNLYKTTIFFKKTSERFNLYKVLMF